MSAVPAALMRVFVGKALAAHRLVDVWRAQRSTARKTPELMEAYAAFARTTQSGSPRQPFKGWDLWGLLERFRPEYIVELGSGTTSAVFSAYARRYGRRYCCFEHSAEWASVTIRCLRQAGLLAGEGEVVRVVPMRISEERRSSGFVEPIPADADFIYVDGPPCPNRDGVKWPNDDVVRLLDSGARPRCIVVDGRTETVELIRSHPASAEYSFTASFISAIRRNAWGEALRFNEHSVFRRLH